MKDPGFCFQKGPVLSKIFGQQSFCLRCLPRYLRTGQLRSGARKTKKKVQIKKYQRFCYLEWSVDNPDLVEAHPDVLYPGVQGDGEHVQGGVGADYPQPRVIALAALGAKSQRSPRNEQNQSYSRQTLHIIINRAFYFRVVCTKGLRSRGFLFFLLSIFSFITHDLASWCEIRHQIHLLSLGCVFTFPEYLHCW